MMKTLSILFGLIISFSSLFANTNTITRNLEDFHIIDIFGNIKITMIQSDSNKAVLSSDLYDISKVTTSVENGKLKIKSNGIGEKNEVFVVLYFKTVDDLTLDGGANLVKSDTLKATNFYLKAVKGSLVQAKIIAENLTVIVNQGSEIRLKGSAKIITVNSNTGGLLDATPMNIKEADLSAVSGGKIYITVTEKITAKAKLKGKINYKGNPKIESIDPSSGGEINKG